MRYSRPSGSPLSIGIFVILFTVVLLLPSDVVGQAVQPEVSPSEEAELRVRAFELVQTSIIVDGHIDVPFRLYGNPDEDITRATAGGDFDYPRAVAGGLNAPFMSIYIPAAYQETGGAKALADSLIDMVEGFEEQAPEKFAIATSPDDVRRHFEQDLISLPMGMENGAGLEGDLANLDHFYERGIRYITLTHSEPNRISDSSYGEERPHQGISDFGREVIEGMNRIGIIVDISHVSDEAFYQAVEHSQAPVIASHSSVRHFTPGWERNMNDDMIRTLADNEGVIMISFGSSFLRNEYQEEGDQVRSRINVEIEAMGLDEPASDAARAYFRQERQLNRIGTVDDVADHIDHVVNLVGVNYVGLGSDYDGVFALPYNLSDASHYPNLVAELLRRGYSDEEIKKILGGNALRVWEEVERVARELD